MSLPQSHRMLPLGLQPLYLHIKAHMNHTLRGTQAAQQWTVRVWFLYLYYYVHSSSQVSLLSNGEPGQVQHHQLWTYGMIIPSSVYPFPFTSAPTWALTFLSNSCIFSQVDWLWVLYKIVNCCERNRKSSFSVKRTRKMANKVGFCTSNFILSVLHHPHSWVCLVYWICTTASSTYTVICILLIIQVLIFVPNSHSACADGLCLVYFTSFNKHLLHLAIIM